MKSPPFPENPLTETNRVGGRKRKMTDSKIESARKLLTDGVPPRDVAENLGVSIPTLYRWVPANTLPNKVQLKRSRPWLTVQKSPFPRVAPFGA